MAPTPVPTMTAVGVARPSAQGQAMTSTAMPKQRAKRKWEWPWRGGGDGRGGWSREFMPGSKMQHCDENGVSNCKAASPPAPSTAQATGQPTHRRTQTPTCGSHSSGYACMPPAAYQPTNVSTARVTTVGTKMEATLSAKAFGGRGFGC